MPAETPYLTSCQKRAVCGDWMVVCAVRYEPVSIPNSLIRAVLQGIFAKKCLFRESRPDFGSNDQRLSSKFPTFVNREFLREIRDSSFRISELLPEIREVSIPPIPGAWLDSCGVPTRPAVVVYFAIGLLIRDEVPRVRCNEEARPAVT